MFSGWKPETRELAPALVQSGAASRAAIQAGIDILVNTRLAPRIVMIRPASGIRKSVPSPVTLAEPHLVAEECHVLTSFF